MRRIGKRSVTIIVGVTVLFASAGIAYAYWSNTGASAGTPSTGTNAAVTVNQTSAIAGLAPGNS